MNFKLSLRVREEKLSNEEAVTSLCILCIGVFKIYADSEGKAVSTSLSLTSHDEPQENWTETLDRPRANAQTIMSRTVRFTSSTICNQRLSTETSQQHTTAME